MEWRTISLIAACYASWLAAGVLYRVDVWAAIIVLVVTITLHSSLQHEAIHRHPTRHARWNEALVFLPLGLIVPFRRYRDLHLKHHATGRLTDPYDDPESFYRSLGDYARLPRVLRMLLAWNNVLAVRLAIGPLIATGGFLLTELRGAGRSLRTERPRGKRLLRAWALHMIGVAVVVSIVRFGFAMPIGAYLVAVYLSQSLLALRSFGEHQWAKARDGRTAIVERSLLAPLFLNNNLHLVHHKHPALPWYDLPEAYRVRRDEWRAINGGYVFSGYGALIRRFGLRMKEPVAHPG